MLRLAIIAASSIMATTAVAGRPGGDEIVLHTPKTTRPTMGPAWAPVTVEFFVDERSSTSRRLFQLLSELRARHPRRVRVIFRFPFSDQFSNLAREAADVGKFAEFMDEVLGTNRYIREPQLNEIVTSLGVDWQRAESSLRQQFHRVRADQDRAHAVRWNVDFTRTRPGLLINGLRQRAGGHTIDTLESAYDAALQRANVLLARGTPRSKLYRRLLLLESQRLPTLSLRVGETDGAPELDEYASYRPVSIPVDYSGPHVDGPANAPVPIAVFCNFQSRPCTRLAGRLRDLRNAYPTEVKLVFKHLFPAQASSDEGPALMHRAALCSDEQGQFWQFYDTSYRRYPRRVNRAYIDDLIRPMGLDKEAFDKCLDNPRLDRTLSAFLQEAASYGVLRTPSIAIGGRLYVGYRTFEELRYLVDQELAPGLLGSY